MQRRKVFTIHGTHRNRSGCFTERCPALYASRVSNGTLQVFLIPPVYRDVATPLRIATPDIHISAITSSARERLDRIHSNTFSQCVPIKSSRKSAHSLQSCRYRPSYRSEYAKAIDMLIPCRPYDRGTKEDGRSNNERSLTTVSGLPNCLSFLATGTVPHDYSKGTFWTSSIWYSCT